jgi:hypothetical protein
MPNTIDLKLYETAVRGRQQFRESYRREREENRRLRAALETVRIKAIPAGAAVILRTEDWKERCIEVLDIIDDALDTKQ